MSHGYRRVRAPGHPMARRGWAYEHRLVLYDAGVDPSGHVVHHRNGDKADNRLENLEVVTRSEHSRSHARWSPWRACPVCGVVFRKRRTITCSYSCGQRWRYR